MGIQGIESTERSVIKLGDYKNDAFTVGNFELSSVLDDIILVSYADVSSDGAIIYRNGIALPVNNLQRAWRIGKVILAGPKCLYVKVGDFVCFPSDKGIPVANLDVTAHGAVRDAMFLNESRVFGVCNVKSLVKLAANESKPTNSKKNSPKKHS